MKFELNLSNEHKMLETIRALKNASEDGYRLSAYEKTLIHDASFIFQAMFDQTESGKRFKAANEKMALNKMPNAALRGDSGLIAAVPLESTVRTEEAE